MSLKYDRQLFEYFERLKRNILAQPQVLGGSEGPSGGGGGPPGGFIGKLPQGKVTYDTTEASASGVPLHPSLVDNLNHIRYNIQEIEDGGVGGHIIFYGGDLPMRPRLSFEGAGVIVTDSGSGGKTVVTIAGLGGGFGYKVLENLSDQVDGITDHFDTVDIIPSGTLSVYYNGLHEERDSYYLDIDGYGFTLDFIPSNGSSLEAEYGTGASPIPDTLRQTIFTFTGDLRVTDNSLKIYNQLGFTQTISKVFLSVNEAPTGDSIIIDIHKNGTTIFTDQNNRPEILVGTTTGYTIIINVPNWLDGEYLTAHIDQVGLANPGADLTVHIIHS